MPKTILIVDDVPDNIRVMKEPMEYAGYIVRVATNGPRALELALVEPLPDLILLDVMMPGMSGYDVCRKLKRMPETARIPVIFVTTRCEIQDESLAFDVGAVDYITKPVSPPTVLRRVATHLSLVKTEDLDALARAGLEMLGEAGHYNDTDTGAHIWRMAAFSRAIAESLGWPTERAITLELAAPMHDTGKIGIPDSILKAPRKLTPEEWVVMKTHPQIGADILGKSNHPVFQMAAEVALNHHEKWDGSGYPRGLSGDTIPESARIVAIADVFDALTMKRAYKEAWTIDAAMEHIAKETGAHFCPTAVEAFFAIEDHIRRLKALWDAREEKSRLDEAAIRHPSPVLCP